MSTVRSVIYRPQAPPPTFAVPATRGDVVLRGVDSPEYGRLYDAADACRTLGLGWSGQRMRIARCGVGTRYLYRSPGTRTLRTYLDQAALVAWVVSLDASRRGRTTRPDTERAIAELLGIDVDTSVYAASAAADGGATVAPASGPTVHASTLVTTIPDPHLDLLRELTATLVAIRTDQTAGLTRLGHMGDTLADHQGQLQAVRAAQAADAVSLRTEIGRVRERLAEVEDRLRGVRGLARHAAETATNADVARLPGHRVRRFVSFDEGCRVFGVREAYARIRAMSSRLAAACAATRYPMYIRPGRAGHNYHVYDLDVIRDFLVANGYAVRESSAGAGGD